MEVGKRFFKSLDGFSVPAYHIRSGAEKAFLVVHGYSSSKTEWLGFAFNIAELGDVFVIDLRGHGEHAQILDENVLNDVEGAIRELKKEYGKVYALGHSLGALLSLCSSADFVYAISPPLSSKILAEAKFMLRLKSCTVREKDREVLFRILEKYNPPERRENAVIFYGRGESDGIKRAIKSWAVDRDVEIVEIDEMQAEMPEVEVSPEKLRDYLPCFISHLSTTASPKIFERLKSLKARI